MSSRSNLVPSKDALRALRSLASSPQAAFVCAVGSVCGLATINYGERCKVKSAERMLESKRALRSMSNGRGPAQIARMFEAAEKGEEFVIHHGRSLKPQKRRLSGLATHPQQSEYELADHEPYIKRRDTQSLPFLKSIAHQNASQVDSKFPGYRQPEEDNIDHGFESAELERPYAKHPPQHDLKEPTESQSINPDSKVRSGSKIESKKPLVEPGDAVWPPQVDGDAVNGALRRMRALGSGANTQPNTFIHLRRLAHRTRLDQQKQQRKPLSNTMFSRGLVDMPTRQRPSDLHPPKELTISNERVEDLSNPNLSAEESVFYNYLFEKPSVHGLLHTDPSQTPHDLGAGSQTKPNTSAQEQSAALSKIETLSFVTQNEAIPEHSVTHHLRSRWLQDRLPETGALDLPSFRRYMYSFNMIANALAGKNLPLALQLFDQALRAMARNTKGDDFVMAKMLILDFAKHIPSPDVTRVVRATVRDLLRNRSSRINAVSLLYPNFGRKPDRRSGNGKLAPRYYELAHRYMAEFCDTNPDFDQQLAELRLIMAGTLRCNLPVAPQLMLPTIRSMISQGLITKAQSCYDQITVEFHLESCLAVTSDLIRGYAAAGNWWKVKSMLSDSAEVGAPWKKVYRFSELFARTLEVFAANNSVEKLCSYAVEVFHSTGVFPTSSVSRRIMIACIEGRRYDLLEQYTSLIQRDYPYLRLGTDMQNFTLELSRAWTRMSATCTDILESCRIIAMNSLQDPFSKGLRQAASRAIVKEITPLIEDLESQGSHKFVSSNVPKGVDELSDAIRGLVGHHHSMGFMPESKRLAEELVHKIRVITRLDAVFSGTNVLQRATSRPSIISTVSAARHVKQPPGRHIPPLLRTIRPPALQSIIDILQQQYTKGKAAGLKADHSTLKYVGGRLADADRHYDQYALMEAVYCSDWTQSPIGTPFDLELLTMWLTAAYEMRSAPKVRRVAWALLDAGPETKMTYDAMMLSRVAVPRAHVSTDTQARWQEIDEGRYLLTRLRRRLWQEKLKAEEWNLVFSEWKSSRISS